MDIHDLHKKIKIVLDEELRTYAAKGRSQGKLGSLNIGLQSMPSNGWTTVGEVPQLLFDKSDPTAISSPNALILLKLYSSLDVDSKANFRNFLIGNLRKGSPYANVAYFSFFVLYRIGETIEALKQARRALAGDSLHGYSNLLGTLSMIISREYLEIDSKTYESVKTVLLGDKEPNFKLDEKINLGLLKLLERDLQDVNPEINTDRDRVLELWGQKFSNVEVPALIGEVDDYFREGEFTDTKYATCIGRIRVLLVEVSKRIALGLAASKSDENISEDAEEHHFFQYLRDKSFISTAEWNLLRSLYAMSSNEGAHTSVSKREHARLIKNMSYEILLLFLSRYAL